MHTLELHTFEAVVLRRLMTSIAMRSFHCDKVGGPPCVVPPWLEVEAMMRLDCLVFTNCIPVDAFKRIESGIYLADSH
jgi:hypothetical protein